MGVDQGDPQARLQAGHLARLHGLVRPELLPKGLQFSAHPARICPGVLDGRQGPRLQSR